ncbi:MAG TPA: hypothetical protein VLY20_09885 [Nitrospiria bacterium]|nr:hypothetical protein [Nitrospiria bacterium]
MDKPLRALIVADSVEDADLLLEELRRGGCDPAYKQIHAAETMTANDLTRWLHESPWGLMKIGRGVE